MFGEPKPVAIPSLAMSIKASIERFKSKDVYDVRVSPSAIQRLPYLTHDSARDQLDNIIGIDRLRLVPVLLTFAQETQLQAAQTNPEDFAARLPQKEVPKSMSELAWAILYLEMHLRDPYLADIDFHRALPYGIALNPDGPFGDPNLLEFLSLGD